MFEYINLRRLRNSEFVIFSQDFLEIIDENNLDNLQLQTLIQDLKTSQSVLSSIFTKERGSEITEELQLLDNLRDNSFNGISLFINSLTYHYEEPKQKAAKTLKHHIEATYGSGVARLNYRAETSVLFDMIDKWKTLPKLKDSIELLALTDWVNQLEKENNDFNEKYHARIKANANCSSQRVSELREEINSKYYNVSKFIEALTTVNGLENYETVIKNINSLIKEYNKLLTMRRSSNGSNDSLDNTDLTENLN